MVLCQYRYIDTSTKLFIILYIISVLIMLCLLSKVGHPSMFIHFGYVCIFVTGSAKRDLIADPNHTHLESHNLTCEFSTTLKLGPNIPLTFHYCLV